MPEGYVNYRVCPISGHHLKEGEGVCSVGCALKLVERMNGGSKPKSAYIEVPEVNVHTPWWMMGDSVVPRPGHPRAGNQGKVSGWGHDIVNVVFPDGQVMYYDRNSLDLVQSNLDKPRPNKFKSGDRVRIKSGLVGTVDSYYFLDQTYIVKFDGEAPNMGQYTEEDLEPVLSNLDKPAAPALPVRLLIEIVPEKDAKHSTRDYVGPHVAICQRDPKQAMSVTNLLPMPSLEKLKDVYWEAVTAHYTTESGLKAVLRVCGLEVE